MPATRGQGLRGRLMLGITALLAVILLVAFATVIGEARRAVRQETRSTVALAADLVSAALPAGPASSGLAPRLEALSGLRHLCLEVVATDGSATPCRRAGPLDAPTWFARLTAPPTSPSQRVTLRQTDQVLVIQADPADEIAEAWADARGLLALIIVFYFVTLVLVFRTLGRATGPVARISAALADVEQGSFERRLPSFALPEFDRIAERFNHMAATLERARAENRRLHSHALDAQENERRRLVRELHDELGQSLTAIRADAAGIVARRDELPADLVASATAIADVAGGIYDSTRAMMRRLRPPGLDELGLTAAMEENLAGWQRQHPAIVYDLETGGPLDAIDSELAIHAFRIVQEALTNVHRHAAPQCVVVRIRADGQAVHVEVADDGRGFDPTTASRGLGLSGMHERADLLGGAVRIDSRPGAGTRVYARLPRARPAPPAPGHTTHPVGRARH